MKVLVALLLIIPTLEIWGLITAGQNFGWLPTLLFVISTGVIGTWLSKQQGVQIFRQAQMQLQQGQIPGEMVLDGIIIFAGGLVLLTPGFFTDLLGIFCLVPVTRGIIKSYLKKWIWKKLQNGSISFNGGRTWRW